MELKAVIGLTPGDVAAEDVLDHRGNVIVKKNTTVLRKLIEFIYPKNNSYLLMDRVLKTTKP